MSTTLPNQERRRLRIYRKPKVREVTGLSDSSIYRLEAQGKFPKRVKLSTSASGWYSDEVHQWVADRPYAADIKKGKK